MQIPYKLRRLSVATVDFSKTAKAIGEMQNTNTWAVTIDWGSVGKMTDDVRFRCISTNIPSQEWSSKEVTINRFKITQPGTLSRNGEIELTFLEGEDAAVTKLFDELDRARFSMSAGSDVQGLSKGWLQLKGTVHMVMHNSQGKITQGYKLVDCDFQPTYETELGNDDQVYQPKLKVKYNWWYYSK